MNQSAEYYIKEQLRACTQIYDFLNNNREIGLDEFFQLSQCVGTSMLAKLRLSPGKDLEKRLSHLFALVKCATMVDPVFQDQILLSFEGLNPSYSFDCDLIIESAGVTWLIDFSSDESYENTQRKLLVLNQKSLDPSLLGRSVQVQVRHFKPEKFHVIMPYFCRDPIEAKPETFTLRLLENLAAKSESYNTAFINNCDRVYDYAIERLSELGTENKLYSSPKLSEEKIKIALSAVTSNSVSDIIRLFANINKKTYQPFIDAIQELTAQFHTVKKSFPHRAAKLTERSLDLAEVLYRLSSDPLAKLLHNALIQSGRVLGIKNDGVVDILSGFPTSKGNKRILSYDSEYQIAAKHVKGHFFIIKFHYSALDKQLRRSILNENEPDTTVPKGTKASLEKCIEVIKQSEKELNEVSRIINKRIVSNSHSTIWDKVITISQLMKQDIGNLGRVSGNLLNSLSFSLSHVTGGCLISHLYEIVKTFAAAIKNSHKDETYYVGVNGPYESITITKMSATQDSFKRTHYCVISRDIDEDDSHSIVWAKHYNFGKISRSHFRTLDHNQVAYLLRLPYYILSLLTWDVESNIDKGHIIKSDIPEKITNSILHCLVNRDVFSQAAQQVRYLYVSSIGFGSNPASIVDKVTFITPVYLWEYVYLIRMIKLGLSLSVVRDSGRINELIVDGELSVVFPHSTRPSKSFTHTVSSMYYCNIFNKYRAFHEVSEAYCYNELDEEYDIYVKAKNTNPDFLSGFSSVTKNNIDDYDYLISNRFVEAEAKFIDKLLESGPGRFKASAIFIISASRKYLKASDERITEIYHRIGRSPIEACTMRGAMQSGPSTDRNQGCRAATAILEELMKAYDIKPEQLNNNSWMHSVFMENIEKYGGDSSIYSFVISQLVDTSIKYIYRIVQKDQIGNREISVLNAVFRLGALFTETVSRTLSSIVQEVDLLEDADKDYRFEVAVQHSIKEKKEDVICYDNSDQKRWGPNHMLNYFSLMFYGSMSKERGLLRILYFVADNVIYKRAKFPESLISLFNKYLKGNGNVSKVTREGLELNHGSETLKTFFKNHANDLFNNTFDKELPYGMCQGIFQATSSVYHAVMCKVVAEVVTKRFGKKVSIRSFCTSDDASRIIKINSGLNRLDVVKFIHNVINGTGILFNILRNESKSAFNFHIAEFNSIFFKQGRMATPSLKQRISKIDVGDGSNHVEDYLACISASANYFTVGGSYSGCITLSVLNITLHTEQWSRWDVVNKGHYFYPVELGGFPIIEPFTTCISGAAANTYLRCAQFLTPREYAEIFSSIVTEEPEQFTLADYFRVPKSISASSNDIKIFKSTGALGIHSLVRTDKKLSQFEQRHKISQWVFPDHFLSLKHQSCDSRFFLYNIYKNGCMSLFAESLGVNSFYKRFTDPWLSRERRCFKISKHSILKVLGLDSETKYSYSIIEEHMSKISKEDVPILLNKIKETNPHSEFVSVLLDQLTPRFDDAREILDFINSQECSDYIEPKYAPATSRITLRGHQALDQEKYTADLIKVLAGEKARFLITEFYSNHRKFDSLPSAEECPNLELKDAILVAENTIFAFNKYIKRNTKMITSGRPDNLSAIVTMTLKSRFFEGIGIRLSGSLKLIGDRSHAFSYTSWYKTLNEKSAEYVTKFANNSARQLYSDVVKYGIISENVILTQKDHFEVIDVPAPPKHVKVKALSRSPLITFVKSWVSACATYSFDYETVQSLFKGKLLSRQEYRVHQDTFVRNATGLYFDVQANGLNTCHLIETDSVGDRTSYTHIFLTEASTREIEIDVEITDLGRSKDWPKSICSFLTKTKRLYTDKYYKMKDTGDQLVFKTVDTATAFELDVCPFSLTIAFKAKDFCIPVAHSNPKNIEELKLGYELNYTDILAAVSAYSKILDATNELQDVSEQVLNGVNYIIYNTTIKTPVKKINDVIRKGLFGIKFDNTRQVDIFKALLLDDKFSSKTVNTNRLYQYINNLFKSSSFHDNYLTSLTLEDKLSLRLDEAVGTDSSDDLESLQSDDDFETRSLTDLDEDIESEEASIADIDVLEKVQDDFDLDDIDFDAFDEDDLINGEEDPFQTLNLSLSSEQDDQVTIKSSRTGLTVNPNNEFPYQLLMCLRRWSRDNPIKRIVGSSGDLTSAADIPRAVLSIFRIAGTVRPDVVHFLTGKEQLTLPCPLSDLITIRAVAAA